MDRCLILFSVVGVRVSGSYVDRRRWDLSDLGYWPSAWRINVFASGVECPCGSLSEGCGVGHSGRSQVRPGCVFSGFLIVEM